MSKDIEKAEKHSFNSTLAQLTDIEAELAPKARCKLCNSTYREEVETKFDETNSLKAAYNILKDNNVDIDYHAMRRHLINHYVSQQRMLDIKEYAGSTLDRMKKSGRYIWRNQIMERIAIFNNQLYTIGSMSAGLDVDENRRSAEIMTKLNNSILSLEQELNQLDNQAQPVNILMNNLGSIITDEINSANKDEKVKQALMNVLNKVINSVKDVVVEKERT